MMLAQVMVLVIVIWMGKVIMMMVVTICWWRL